MLGTFSLTLSSPQVTGQLLLIKLLYCVASFALFLDSLDSRIWGGLIESLGPLDVAEVPHISLTGKG